MTIEAVRSTPDASVSSYRMETGRLTIHMTMWDDTQETFVAEDVDFLHDEGTHESDAIVRVPDLDQGSRQGFGIIDTENNLTLQFRAESFAFGPPGHRAP